MRHPGLLRESIRSGTIASLAMVPFGLLFKFLDLRIGHYGPKLAALLFNEPGLALLFVQHLVVGWVSAFPLLLLLMRLGGRAPAMALGAAYGAGYYVVVNSFALPLAFADPTPWQSGFSVVYPSLLVHVVFGMSIAFTARKFLVAAPRPQLPSSRPGSRPTGQDRRQRKLR